MRAGRSPSRRQPRWLYHLLAATLVTLLYLSGALENAEYRVMDSRFELLTKPLSSALVLVDIDPRSLRELRRWPWPRSHHATVLDALIAAGAAQVAFDIEFSSTSVAAEDTTFERALEAAAGKVVLAAFTQLARQPDGATAIVNTEPLPAFVRHARLASINVQPAADAVIRRMAVFAPWAATRLETLPTSLAGNTKLPTRPYYIDYGFQPDTLTRIAFVDVLRGSFDPALVADRRVIVGATAIELGDQVPVPLYRSMPGPILQALAYNTLRGAALQRPAGLLVVFGTFALALVLGQWFARCDWRRGLVGLLICTAMLFCVSLAVQTGAAVLLDLVPWILTACLSFGIEQVRRIDRQTLQLFLQGVEIRRKDAMMGHVVANSFDGIVTFDASGTVATANPAAEGMLGYRGKRLTGVSAARLFPELSQADPWPPGADEAAAEATLSEMPARRADGSTFPAEITTSVLQVAGERLLTVFLRDISERKRQEHALEHQAKHDALTDLPNRHLLFEKLGTSLSAAQRDGRQLALLLLDLDRFKEVNDTLGHHTGDLVLQEIGPRLRRLVGTDGIVARLGGDEFAILIDPVTDADGARQVAEEALTALRRPFEIRDLSLEVGGSVGIALFPDHGRDATALLQCADVAMYTAKNSLQRVSLYDAGSDRNSVRELTLSGRLRRAIDQDELTLHYQPKLDLATGRIIGVEALVRWHHPDHGLIRPDEFIAVAEQTGLIHPLSLWVLETATAQCSDWRQRGLALDMAVNLSARVLQDQRLPERVRDCAVRYGAEPDWLTLELTESALMADPEHALRAITVLSGDGFHFSIDDFGTGYSSLAYLKRLPATELKIDRSFVSGLTDDAGNLKIVRSTIDLAHGFGLKVVAEGIESAADVQALEALDCDVGQGYHIARPTTAAALEVWLAERAGPPGPSAQRLAPAAAQG